MVINVVAKSTFPEQLRNSRTVSWAIFDSSHYIVCKHYLLLAHELHKVTFEMVSRFRLFCRLAVICLPRGGQVLYDASRAYYSLVTRLPSDRAISIPSLHRSMFRLRLCSTAMFVSSPSATHYLAKS